MIDGNNGTNVSGLQLSYFNGDKCLNDPTKYYSLNVNVYCNSLLDTPKYEISNSSYIDRCNITVNMYSKYGPYIYLIYFRL